MKICGSNNTNKLSPQEPYSAMYDTAFCSNNTNKLSPQELSLYHSFLCNSSNNTNKLSPQEPAIIFSDQVLGSNNTNKLSPQELSAIPICPSIVQIIQINLALKNWQKDDETITLFK